MYTAVFLFMLFVLIVVWVIWNSTKPKKYDNHNYSKPTGISQGKRSLFVEMYNNQDWEGIIKQFDGYDFTKEGNQFNDYQAMAHAWLKMGDDTKANYYLDKAVGSGYSYQKLEAYLNMAIIFREEGRYQEALEMVLKSNPSQFRADKNWSEFYRAMRVGGECFKNLGLVDEGITFLKQAPTSARILDHDLADVFALLGEFYEEKGQYEKALKSYQKVVTVRYDKDLNKKILDLNQLVYEAEQEKDERKAKQKRKKGNDFFDK